MYVALGLLGLIFYAACVIVLAAACTWLVGGISPSGKKT